MKVIIDHYWPDRPVGCRPPQTHTRGSLESEECYKVRFKSLGLPRNVPHWTGLNLRDVPCRPMTSRNLAVGQSHRVTGSKVDSACIYYCILIYRVFYLQSCLCTASYKDCGLVLWFYKEALISEMKCEKVKKWKSGKWKLRKTDHITQESTAIIHSTSRTLHSKSMVKGAGNKPPKKAKSEKSARRSVLNLNGAEPDDLKKKAKHLYDAERYRNLRFVIYRNSVPSYANHHIYQK